MRYLIVIFLLSSLSSFAQEPNYTRMYSNYQYRGIRVDSLFLLPKFADTNSVTNSMKNIHGNLIRVDKKFFFRDTALSKWTELAGGGATDTTSLSNRIDGKLSISDTAAMLNSYLLEQDTASLSDRIVLKLNISDTSTMLSPYARANDIDLQYVTDKGAVTNDTIGVYGVDFYDVVNSQSLLLNVVDYSLQFAKPDSTLIFLASPETFSYWNPSGFATNLNFRGTASRDIDLPDSSGTVALLSNLNGITLQSVTDNGDTTTNDIYANSYYLYEQVDGGYGRVYLADNVMEFSSANGNLFYIEQGSFTVYNGNISGTFSVANITNNRNYNFPDTSGTVILSSDTASMLFTYIRSSIFPIATFGGGSGAAGDTTIFTTDAIYGSFYNAGTDSIVVTSIDTVQRSGSVTTTVYYNTSINTSGATTVTAGSTIPPARHVWVQTTAITTKPTYYSVTLNGYRKRP